VTAETSENSVGRSFASLCPTREGAWSKQGGLELQAGIIIGSSQGRNVRWERTFICQILPYKAAERRVVPPTLRTRHVIQSNVPGVVS
jgi:hypothetical protein